MKELLTKKYAGLPGWAWLIVGAAGIGLGVFFIRKQSSTTGTPSDLTAQSTPDLTTADTTSDATGTVGSVGGNGVINNPFPETNINGNQVPIIPAGYQAIYDNSGNIVGYEPTPPNNTSTPGNSGSGNSGSGSGIISYVTTKAGASLETTPHDIGGGKNILTLPLGAILTYVSGPIPDPTGAKKDYYLVSYGGKIGWVGSDAVIKQSTGNPTLSGPFAANTPQSLTPSKR